VAPKVKLDITSDEVLVDEPVVRPIGRQCSDAPLPIDGVLCYSLTELFGEKLRALAQRCRPRDLYDVVHMHRHPDLIGLEQAVAAVLAQKCSRRDRSADRRGHPVVSPSGGSRGRVGEHARAPAPRPAPALRRLLVDARRRLPLAGRHPAGRPAASGIARKLDPDWKAPRAITSWRQGVPVELLRYAGVNRLKVDVDYRAEDGRWGSRRVEPYSLRYTQDGNLILFVVNDYGELRGYRVDRIAGTRPTTETFTPRYRVEF
jgi:hypothetical protein